MLKLSYNHYSRSTNISPCQVIVFDFNLKIALMFSLLIINTQYLFIDIYECGVFKYKSYIYYTLKFFFLVLNKILDFFLISR